MQVIRTGKITDTKCVVALGNFDGLHTAHTAVINNAIAYAKSSDFSSCVLLFSNHTKDITDKKNIRLITSEQEKLDILRGIGVDIVYIRDFDEKLMQLSPCEFVDVLKDTLNPVAVSVGYDYRFGYRAEGDVNTLKELCSEYGIDVIVKDEILCSGEPVKSTKIRECIENGEMREANVLLGREYFIMGEVVKGLQNGRKLGTPTANVDYKPNKILPKNGVYRGYTIVDGIRYKSIINVGNNPTFGAEHITVESHIIGFTQDIYGKTVKLEFTDRIRDEKKFPNLDELKRQIANDIKTAFPKGE